MELVTIVTHRLREHLILETVFRFWPIESAQELRGWAYGRFKTLETLPHRQLLEKGRLRSGRRKKGMIPKFTEAQVQASFVRHEDLGLALETERVLLETGELDEQRYCEPTAFVSEERARNALLYFMGLRDGNTGDAVGYIREFGEFDTFEVNDDGLVTRGVPDEIQQFCQTPIRPERERIRGSPFVVSLSDFWAVRKNIVGLWDLSTAVSQGNERLVRDICLCRRPGVIFHSETNWLAVGRAILCTDLSASLNSGGHHPRLILHEKEGKLVLLTMCMNVRTALHLMLLKMIVCRTEYKRCANRNCGKYFVVNVPGKKFHSPNCQNAAKVKKWRDRHKSDAG
jgi:hypothetical protein